MKKEMTKLFIYALSLVPLLIYWAIENLNLIELKPSLLDNYIEFALINQFSLISLLVMLVLLEIQFIIERKRNKIAKGLSIKIKEIENKKQEPLIFLMTYIFPIMGSDISSNKGVIKSIFLIILIGSILLKTEYYCYSPTLSLLGYRVYEIKFVECQKIQIKTVLIRGYLKKEDVIKKIDISEHLLIGYK